MTFLVINIPAMDCTLYTVSVVPLADCSGVDVVGARDKPPGAEQ